MRPAPERQAWKALFDHYVFREHGHPLAHLPAHQHGLLVEIELPQSCHEEVQGLAQLVGGHSDDGQVPGAATNQHATESAQPLRHPITNRCCKNAVRLMLRFCSKSIC